MHSQLNSAEALSLGQLGLLSVHLFLLDQSSTLISKLHCPAFRIYLALSLEMVYKAFRSLGLLLLPSFQIGR